MSILSSGLYLERDHSVQSIRLRTGLLARKATSSLRANTRTETCRKFQPQLGRVALLAKRSTDASSIPFGASGSSPMTRMRALESYIIAQAIVQLRTRVPRRRLSSLVRSEDLVYPASTIGRKSMRHRLHLRSEGSRIMRFGISYGACQRCDFRRPRHVDIAWDPGARRQADRPGCVPAVFPPGTSLFIRRGARFVALASSPGSPQLSCARILTGRSPA